MGVRSKVTTVDSTASQLVMGLFLALAAYLLMIGQAHADIGDVLCNAADLVQGNLGKGLATIGILSVGVGALFGKVSWTMAVTVAVGIGVLFGAQAIYTALTGDAGC